MSSAKSSANFSPMTVLLAGKQLRLSVSMLEMQYMLSTSAGVEALHKQESSRIPLPTMSKQALQLIFIPHRPTPTEEEINADLAPAIEILQSAPGLKAVFRGKKYEERYTQVLVLVWESLASSHAFFISPAYGKFHKVVQPALNGRKVEWQQHALLGTSDLDSDARLKSILNSPAIEVALTKVVEGGVSGYYDQFRAVVTKVLEEDPGCDGYFISPQIENPQDQILLINWKTVDAHHEEFEKRPGFKACIDALFNYYASFVVPWHIVGLKLTWGSV